MEAAIVSLVPLAMTLTGMVMLAQGGLSSMDLVSTSWREMGAKAEVIASTRVSQEEVDVRGSQTVRITLRNEGPTASADFAQWDVIVQYYPASGTPYLVRWLPYSPGALSDNQWRVVGIYMDAAGGLPEVLGPGILDPCEEILLELKLKPAIGPHTTNWVTIGPSRAIPLSVHFERN